MASALNPVRWLLELKDGVSNPAKKMVANLGGISGIANGFVGGLRGLVGGLGQVGEKAGSALGFMAKLGLTAEFLKKAFGAIVKGGETVIQAVQFRDDAKGALEAYEGSAEAGREALAYIDKLSNAAGLDTKPLVDYYTQLKLAGYTAKNTRDILAAAADASSRFRSPEALGKFVDVFKGIANKEIKSDTLFEFLPVKELRAKFTEFKGTTDKEFKDWIKGGTVNSYAFGNKVLEVIQGYNFGKGLGASTEAIRKNSPEAAIARIKENIKKLLGDDGLLGGKLASTIDTFGKLFDKNTVEGAAFAKNVGDGINAIVDALKDPKTIKSFVDGLLAMSKALPAIAKVVGPVVDEFSFLAEVLTGVGDNFDYIANEMVNGDNHLRRFVDAVASVASPITGLLSDLQKTDNLLGAVSRAFAATVRAVKNFGTGLSDEMKAGFESAKETFDEIVDQVTDFGGDIVDGIKTGISNKWEDLKTAISDLAKDLPGPIKKVLGIASPSKVFMDIGANTVEGFNLGVDKEAANTNDTLTKAIMPDLSAFKPANANAAAQNVQSVGSPNVVVNVAVNVAQAGATAEQVAAQTSREVENAIHRVFESMSLRRSA